MIHSVSHISKPPRLPLSLPDPGPPVTPHIPLLLCLPSSEASVTGLCKQGALVNCHLFLGEKLHWGDEGVAWLLSM